MTNQELEVILNANIPNHQKSELIQQLVSVQKFQDGGKTEEVPEKKSGSIKRLNPTETIQIGGKDFDVEVADTEEKRVDGLSRVKKLADDEGMLFIFEEPTTTTFTMAETSIDLDICFIDGDGVVISVESVKAKTKEPVRCSQPYSFVLEVKINSGVQPGDELDQDDEDFSEDEKQQVSKSKMLVLDSNGDVQMKLVGGERIVSRIKTRQLIKAALKAYKTDEDKDYRRVGKLIINELDAQDSRDPQYVEK